MAGFTEASIKVAEAPATGRRIISDKHRDAPRGFALRIEASGVKSFCLRYKAGGRDRLLGIGEWPTWSLAAARDQARKYRRQIDSGDDILEGRRAERRELTVREAVDRYCSTRTDKQARGRDVRSSLERHLVAQLGTVKLPEVRRRDVIAVVEAIAQHHGRTAALLLVYIKGLFAWAADRDLVDADPAAGIKPARVSPAMASRSRARVLDDEELRHFWERAESCGMHRLTALALKMILTTGQRPGEVAGMRWDEVDGRTWTIPASRRLKTKTAQSVPLTDAALEVLDAARAELDRLGHRRRSGPPVFVFETRPGSSPDTNALARAVKRYADAIGNRDASDGGHWRPHDLRRTARTGLAAAGIGETVAELTIGHTRKGIAAVYDQHAYDAEKRAALEAWERRLLRIVAGKSAEDNVETLRARA